jgi:hypothetical protein
MTKSLNLILTLLLTASTAFAASPPYVRNNSLSTNLNTENLYPGSAAVDAIGRQFGGWFVPSSMLLNACSSAATGTADTQIVATPGAGNRIFVTSISCANTTAVASQINLKDGTTIEFVGGIGTAAATGGDFQKDFTTPWRLAQNVALQFAMATTATSTTCCAQYFILAE